MATKIQAMPRRRRQIAVAAPQQQQIAPPPTLPPPPITQGVDAVVEWFGRLNLHLLGDAAPTGHKLKTLQTVLSSFSRVRSPARDVEMILRARQQREGYSFAAAYGDEAPVTDAQALPLWHAMEIARLAQLVLTSSLVDAEDYRNVSARLKHHVAGVQVREVAETTAFKRRHKIGADVAGAVEGYAAVQAELEAEQLTAGDAERARTDLIAFGHFMKSDFASPWHIQVVCDALMKVERREIRGLIINMPPRRGKSTCTSELFPAWFLGRNPSEDVIVGTHSGSFADGCGRKVRNAIASSEFQRVFPGVRVAQDSSAAAAFEIVVDGASVRHRRGNFRAFGRGASVTGNGAALLVIDDFLSESDAYSSTERGHILDDLIAFRTRLAPDAVWVVINTRYHEDDVVGVVQRDFADDRQWTVITLPEFAEKPEEWIVNTPASKGKPSERRVFSRDVGDALWPERWPAEASAQLRSALLKVAPQKWWGQFMCRPVAESGAMVDPAWFRRYDYADVMDLCRRAVRIVVSVDTGGTKLRQISSASARTAITVWAEMEDGRAYLVDVKAEPWIYPDIVAQTKEACRQWKPTDLLIENKAAGLELIADLSEHRDWPRTPITSIMPVGPKETRMAVASPQIRAGLIYLPAATQCADVPSLRCSAPAWLVDFVNEVMHFPHSRYRDISDSTSQMLNWRRENPVQGSGFSTDMASTGARRDIEAALRGPWGARGGNSGGSGVRRIGW